jgi:hypothetical protein
MNANREATLTSRSPRYRQPSFSTLLACLVLALPLTAPLLQAAERQDGAELVWSDKQQPAAKGPRQTSFDNTNYRPPASVNVIQPPTESYWPGADAPRYASREQQVRHDAWAWESANHERQHGRFEWIERDGAINYSSVCQNYRKGSIIYRDCRKGAKQAFARLCSSYKPACHAANNFMP